MLNFGPDTYGQQAAESYDARNAFKWKEVSDVVRALAELADDGPVLDVGVGTGRIALPLAEIGLEVVGLDVSAAMIEKAEEADVGSRVSLVLSDAAAEPITGAFSLIYCVYNTCFMMGDAERQGSFLKHAAAALLPGGRLVIEAFVPRDDVVGPAGTKVAVAEMHGDSVTLAAVVHRREQQLMENQEIVFNSSGWYLRPARFHYLHDHQLDDLAVAAGLSIDRKWKNWQGEPLDDSAKNMILIYQKKDCEEQTQVSEADTASSSAVKI